MPKASSTTQTFEDVLTAINNKSMKVTKPVAGDSFKLGGATVTILAPNGSGYDDTNNYSIVLRITYGSTSFMLDGDAESLSESQILSKCFDVKADVVKIGRHGSSSSTSQVFLDKEPFWGLFLTRKSQRKKII
jgi:competence protein ComEC